VGDKGFEPLTSIYLSIGYVIFCNGVTDAKMGAKFVPVPYANVCRNCFTRNKPQSGNQD
jgi:hypothetical protein